MRWQSRFFFPFDLGATTTTTTFALRFTVTSDSVAAAFSSGNILLQRGYLQCPGALSTRSSASL